MVDKRDKRRLQQDSEVHSGSILKYVSLFLGRLSGGFYWVNRIGYTIDDGKGGVVHVNVRLNSPVFFETF